MTKEDSQPNTVSDDANPDVESPPTPADEGTVGIEQELELKNDHNDKTAADAAVVEVAEVVEGEEGDEGKEGNNRDKKVHMKVSADAPWSERMWEVFSTFWPLGLVAFGGPQVKRNMRCNLFLKNCE